MGRSLYGRVRDIIESARQSAARSVNTAQVVANWLVGREIVQEEQKGASRAGYGKRLLEGLSRRLQTELGKGYSKANIEYFRRFFIEYPRLLQGRNVIRPVGGISIPLIDDSIPDPLGRELAEQRIGHPVGGQSWRPGLLNPNLSWRHYRTLLRVTTPAARPFYELEAVKNRWSGRELERQINSLLYERLALSKDKDGLMKLATEGHEVRRSEGDGPTLGLILCTDKNDAVVRYTLGRGRKKIFASRYKLHLPTEAELAAELRRELSEFRNNREEP